MTGSFAVAGGQAYVDGGGPAGSAFWACDLGPDTEGGGTVLAIGIAGVRQTQTSEEDLRAMVTDLATAVRCPTKG